MKKIFVFAFLFSILIPASIFAAEPGNDIKIYVDGKQLALNAPPVIRDERTLVPVRAIAEALDVTVVWDESDRSVSLTKHDADYPFCVMWIDYDIIDTGGGYDYIETPPVIINNVTMLPLRVVAELLECKVDWDDETRSVFVSTPAHVPSIEELYGIEPFDSSYSYSDGMTIEVYLIYYDEYPEGDLAAKYITALMDIGFAPVYDPEEYMYELDIPTASNVFKRGITFVYVEITSYDTDYFEVNVGFVNKY